MAMTHKLNIHSDGKLIASREFPSFVAMMDAARAMRDEVVATVGGFVVAQSQEMHPISKQWSHLAILS